MLTLIVNPTAGNGFAKKIIDQLHTELEKSGVAFKFVYTEYPGHATELAKAAANDAGCHCVVSVGGDGTAYEVACGLIGTKVAMGIIPAGTGNDFIKTVGIPKQHLDALNFILNGKARPVDVGSMNERMFLNVCGTGFDVTALDYTQDAKKYCRGILPYLIGLVRGIFHYAPVHVKFTFDGVEQERDVLMCGVCNGRFFGGGFPICPASSPDDGFLDLVVVDNVPRWKIPFYIPGILMGKVLGFKITRHYRCKSVKFEAAGMRLDVDGEIIPMESAEFTVQPGKLMLYW